MSEFVTAFAPASIGNVGVGFDVLGLALEGVGDRVLARKTEAPGVTVAEVRGLDGEIHPYLSDDPDRYLDAALFGIADILRSDAGARLEDVRVDAVKLGTTVATNALLERKGARVGLVTNAGFEDVIEIGRQNRPQLYALVGHRAAPLVDRSHRIGLRGRLGPAGVPVRRMSPSSRVK